MWEYASILGILFMTWYDNLWLMKFERFARKKLSYLVWGAVKWYARKNKNEMIKDGYHVDAVYLYVHEPEYIKQYDMLRIFRDMIRDEILRDGQKLDIWEFVEECSDPDTNFNKVNKDFPHILEVNYTFDLKKYKIFFDTENNTSIQFPIYSELNIRERDVSKGGINAAFLTHYENPDTDDPTSTDVTESLRKFSGPLQNFYQDTDYVVRKEWFLDDYIGVGKAFDSLNNCYIHIIDFKGNTHVIGADQDILSTF